MHFRQFYLGCLAHASYLIGSEGEACVVDPRRDVDEYLDEARAHGLTIRYIIETHLHADFVGGHRELAERTGATIVFGAKAEATIRHRAVEDGDEIALGRVVLRFLETPGHTPESITILVIDTETSDLPRMALTGDTLFIGDVGRPDLVGSKGFTPDAMAGMLYDSLHLKLLQLDDDVAVYPAHGAGSLCGRNLSQETSSTIGEQRRTNYALRPMPKDDFVRMMTTDLPEVPQYFSRDVAINREGAPPLTERALPPALSAADTRRFAADGALVLDVRHAAAFGTGHVPDSLNIGLGGQFASWSGSLLDATRPLIIVADDEAGAGEAATRLARVGIENVAGFLEGGIAAWDRAGLPIGVVGQVPVDELHAWISEKAAQTLQILDVRRPAEYAGGHVPGAVNVPLDRLDRAAAALPRSGVTAVICAGGYRSSAATSILRRHKFSDVYNVIGGTSAWVAAGHPSERA
jgi:glyoxylase-like metal-dependent hydrolase (beta-lactamase superfamily II)/rhodanese-related sulfurtransferase